MRTPTSLTQRRRSAAALIFCVSASLRLGVIPFLLANQAVADWPIVRGDTAGTGVAETKIADDLDVLWKLEATGEDAAFEAAAVIDKGVVYIGDAAGVLRALQLATGEPVWQKTFKENWFTTSAMVDNGRLYVVDSEGVVLCLATADGKELWRHATESETSAGPNLHNGTLLVTTEVGALIALDAKTGEEQWRYAIDGPLRCSPSVAATNGSGHVLLAGCDARLTAVDLTTGEEVGAVGIGGQTGSTAAFLGDRAYFGTEAGEFLAIDLADVANPNIAWRYRDPRRGQGIRTAAAVTDAAVVYGSQGKSLYCLNRTTGEPLWKLPQRSRIESSPVIVGNRVFAATTRGRLLLLDLKDGETVWDYDAGGSFTASPAIADGRVVIGNTDGTLFCFGKRE